MIPATQESEQMALRKSDEKLLRLWRGRLGCIYYDQMAEREGEIVRVEWRTRTETGGDWGVFVTLRNERGEFTGRPAYLQLVQAPEDAAPTS